MQEIENVTISQETDGRTPGPWTDSQRKEIEFECIEIINRECELNSYDITNIKMSNWAYILDTIHQEIFNKRPYLLHNWSKAKNDYRGTFIDKNIEYLYIIYKRLCNRYNTIIRKRHFYILSGLDRFYVYDYKDYKTLSYTNTHLLKDLDKDCEESLINAAFDDRGNPVKYIAALNHYHSWDKGGGTPEDTQKQAIGLADLPKIELSRNSGMIPGPTDDDND